MKNQLKPVETDQRFGSRAGFSLVETLVAASISTVILGAVMSSAVWIGEQSVVCAKIAWSQTEARMTSSKIIAYARNATAIHAIDVADGNWVDLQFGEGEIYRISYLNPETTQRDGKLYLYRVNEGGAQVGTKHLIVANGMMAVPFSDGSGFTEHIFTGDAGGRRLNVAYRVSSPNAEGLRATDDSAYAVVVRFGTFLRNSAEDVEDTETEGTS